MKKSFNFLIKADIIAESIAADKQTYSCLLVENDTPGGDTYGLYWID